MADALHDQMTEDARRVLSETNLTIAMVMSRYNADNEADRELWVKAAQGLAIQCETEAVRWLVIFTFRHLLEVPTLHSEDQATLRWLTDLYLKLRLEDNQFANLPFPVSPAMTIGQGIGFLWAHLQLMAKTLTDLRAMYAAGYIRLMSRSIASALVHQSGDYILRLSNREPNQLVLTYRLGQVQAHHYLARSDVERVGEHEVTVAGQAFTIYQWHMEMVKRQIKRLGLTRALFGSVPIEALNAAYEAKVRDDYGQYLRVYSRPVPVPVPVQAPARPAQAQHVPFPAPRSPRLLPPHPPMSVTGLSAK